MTTPEYDNDRDFRSFLNTRRVKRADAEAALAAAKLRKEIELEKFAELEEELLVLMAKQELVIEKADLAIVNAENGLKHAVQFWNGAQGWNWLAKKSRIGFARMGELAEKYKEVLDEDATVALLIYLTHPGETEYVNVDLNALLEPVNSGT